jgi:hypothetical protein
MHDYNRSPDKGLRDCCILQRDVAERKHVTRNWEMGQVCVPQTPPGVRRSDGCQRVLSATTR